MLNDAEFETWLKSTESRDLLEFTARQGYTSAKEIALIKEAVSELQKKDRRTFGLVGSAGVFVGGIIVGIGQILFKSN